MYSAQSAWLAKLMSMTLAGWPSAHDEVHEAAVGEQVDRAAVGHHELLDERAHLSAADGHLPKLRALELDGGAGDGDLDLLGDLDWILPMRDMSAPLPDRADQLAADLLLAGLAVDHQALEVDRMAMPMPLRTRGM